MVHRPAKREPSEFELIVDPDNDEVLAIEYCKQYPEYFVELLALTTKQELSHLQNRDNTDAIDASIKQQLNGSAFGRGSIVSVHVIKSVRCFKVKFIQFTASEDFKGRALWVPIMTEPGLSHLQVQQLRKVRDLICRPSSFKNIKMQALISYIDTRPFCKLFVIALLTN